MQARLADRRALCDRCRSTDKQAEKEFASVCRSPCCRLSLCAMCQSYYQFVYLRRVEPSEPRKCEIITNTRMAFTLRYCNNAFHLLTNNEAINVLWLSRLSWLAFRSGGTREPRRKCEKTCCMCIARPLSRRPTQLTLLFWSFSSNDSVFSRLFAALSFFSEFSRSRLQRALKRRLQNCLWLARLASVTSWAWSSNLAVCSRGVSVKEATKSMFADR